MTVVKQFKYEVGEEVRCIEVSTANVENLHEGWVYTVTGASLHDGNVIYAVRDMQDRLYYSPDHFELFVPETIQTSDPVNHPSHYTQGRFEVIDVIEDATKDLKGINAICVGNILKYVLRFQFKNGVEDLKKAEFYLKKLIKNYEVKK